MSDEFYAAITFRKADIEKNPRLKKALDAEFGEGAGKEYSNGTVMFDNSYALNGEFCGIEELAQALAVPFNRHSEGFFDIDPGNVYFRPGEGLIHETIDHDGEPTVLLSDIKQMLVCKKDNASLRRALEALVAGHKVEPLEHISVPSL